MLNEQQIFELMRDNERAYVLADDERSRIAELLDSHSRNVSDQEVVGRAVDASYSTELASSDRRPWPALAFIAAAALVIVGLAVTLNGNRDRPVSTVAGPETQATANIDPVAPTPDPLRVDVRAGEAFCAGPFAALSDAIAGWNGVTNWSYLTDDRDPAPHLPALSAAALDGLEEIVTSDELTMSRTQLDEALRQVEDPSVGFEIARRQMVAALTSIVESVRTVVAEDIDAGFVRFSGCDLSTFRAEG